MGKVYCDRCGKKCVGDVLKVGEKYFHQRCFNCHDCGVQLDAGGFFFRNNSYYCPVDYTARFSNKCFICRNVISSEVVSALNHHFHRDCFKCNICNNIFAPGNRVTMKNDKFICSSCSNENENVNSKKSSAKAPSEIFPKPVDTAKSKDALFDDTVTDQGYMSGDPTSLSSPIQIEEDDIKTQSFKEPVLRNIKSKSNTTRSLFDFGKFYKFSYLDIQEKQEKEHQTKLKSNSSQSFVKKFFTSNGQQHFSSKRPLKSQYSEMSSILSGNRFPGRIMDSVSENDINEKENIIRLSSYPAGEKHPDNIPYPIERDDWPAPLSSAVLMQEKKQRKQNFFGISVQNQLNQVHTNDVLDYTQSLDHLAMQKPKNQQKNLLEVINTSERLTSDQIFIEDVISASRSPSAGIEPVTKPRFANHTNKSKSRDSSYFNDPGRHHGYSLDFISSTNRLFLPGNVPSTLKPGYTKGMLYDLKINSLLKSPNYGNPSCERPINNGNNNNHNSISNTLYSWTANRTMSDTFDVQMKNSEYDLTFDDNVEEFTSSEIDSVTGLKSRKNKYLKEKVKEPTLTSGRSSINSKIESFETWSFWSHKPVPGVKLPVILYSELVSRDPKIMKTLDIHKLETYLSNDEFQSLFKLTRSEFYRLPEWKQNDLKRKINLF